MYLKIDITTAKTISILNKLIVSRKHGNFLSFVYDPWVIIFNLPKYLNSPLILRKLTETLKL